MMNRLVKNALSIPKRLTKSLMRLLDPAYALQRQANRAVPKLLSAERLHELQSIPGTSSAREGRLLAYLAMQAPAGGCFVEIGAFKGKSAAMLVDVAERHPDRPPVVSIDPHADFPDYYTPGAIMNTWAEFSETVSRFRLQERGLEIRRNFSHDVGVTWNRPISFLWIDGGHEYPDVVHDIEDFVPHVLPGAWVVFDDARGGKYPGVERAIAERMLRRPGFRHLGAIKHFEIFQKVAAPA